MPLMILPRLDVVKGRISELENISIETSKTEKQREKRLKKKKTTAHPKTMGQLQKM